MRLTVEGGCFELPKAHIFRSEDAMQLAVEVLLRTRVSAFVQTAGRDEAQRDSCFLRCRTRGRRYP